MMMKAVPQVLRNIQKVNYLAYPGFMGPNGTYSVNITSMENKFALGPLNVYAGPRINATVFFRDNQVIKYPTLRTAVQCTPQTCPILFTVIPKLSGLNIKLDGSEESGNIVKIHVAWGDGTTNEGHFPFMHKYSKPGLYTVTIAATSNLRVTVSQSIQTTTLLLENSIPKGSAFGVSAKANAALSVNTTASSIQDNTPISFIISGKLSSLNDSVVTNVPLDINIFLVANHNLYDVTYTQPTGANGTYKQVFDNFNLLNDGLYKIIVKPTGQRYSTLNATKDLTVMPHPLTTDQLVTYLFAAIGAVVAVIGGVVKIPSYITQVKQSNNFRLYLLYLNFEYSRYKKTKNPSPTDKDRYLDALETSRNNFMDLVASRKITANQYNMLDDLVSRYINNIGDITTTK